MIDMLYCRYLQLRMFLIWEILEGKGEVEATKRKEEEKGWATGLLIRRRKHASTNTSTLRRVLCERGTYLVRTVHSLSSKAFAWLYDRNISDFIFLVLLF